MPVLGRFGSLSLQRDLPDPVTVDIPDINYSRNSFYLESNNYWTGDLITLYAPNGLPVLDKKSKRCGCPEGYGMYVGGRFTRSPIRPAQNESSKFYAKDTDGFYNSAPKKTQADYFIYRNQLDEISLFPSEATALNNAVPFAFHFAEVDSGQLTVSPIADLPWSNSKLRCVGKTGSFGYSDIIWKETGLSLCAYAPLYTEPVAGTTDWDNADVQPRGDIAPKWSFVSSLQDWTLNLKASEIDTSALGETYGTALKSHVSGGGTLNFLFNLTKQPNVYNSQTILRLMLMIDKGCKAKAQFWLVPDENDPKSAIANKSGLYYSTELLLVASAINMRATDILAGTADFVTTGPIQLRVSTPGITA